MLKSPWLGERDVLRFSNPIWHRITEFILCQCMAPINEGLWLTLTSVNCVLDF